mmetsp:Transcript_3722/g.9479  ORF Transcript_3722/g.9479 Transcript_3722/m.9479 type:complete len:94 (-) Transcript_3722:118-399(-)
MYARSTWQNISWPFRPQNHCIHGSSCPEADESSLYAISLGGAADDQVVRDWIILRRLGIAILLWMCRYFFPSALNMDGHEADWKMKNDDYDRL